MAGIEIVLIIHFDNGQHSNRRFTSLNLPYFRYFASRTLTVRREMEELKLRERSSSENFSPNEFLVQRVMSVAISIFPQSDRSTSFKEQRTCHRNANSANVQITHRLSTNVWNWNPSPSFQSRQGYFIYIHIYKSSIHLAYYSVFSVHVNVAYFQLRTVIL